MANNYFGVSTTYVIVKMNTKPPLNLIKFLSFSFFILLLFQQCDEDHDKTKPEDDLLFFEVRIEDEPLLLAYLEDLNLSVSSSGRISSYLDNVDLNKAAKREYANGHIVYTLNIPDPNSRVLKNLWVYQNQEGVQGRIIIYTMDLDWYQTLTEFPGWDNYNGVFQAFDLNDELMYQSEIENGEFVPFDNNNGRVLDIYSCENNTRTDEFICETDTWEICVYGYCNIGVEVTCEWYSGCGGDAGTGGGSIYDPGSGGGSGGSSGSSSPGGCPMGTENVLGRCVPVCPTNYDRASDGNCYLVRYPCDGDPLVYMDITPTSGSGKRGGRHGCTRNGSHKDCPPGRKKHNGFDLTANIGTPVYSPYEGIVTDVRDTFNRMEYLEDSYGNYVTVRYQDESGNTFYMKFNHLG